METGNKMQPPDRWMAISARFYTAGQPQPEQFSWVAAQGIRHVVNLAMPDHPKAVADEGAHVTQTGMHYYHLPVPFDAPQPRHVRQFYHLLQVLDDEPVLIHCIMNYRASAFLSLYLRHVAQWPQARAQSVVYPDWTPDAVWSALLQWTPSQIGLDDEAGL